MRGEFRKRKGYESESLAIGCGSVRWLDKKRLMWLRGEKPYESFRFLLPGKEVAWKIVLVSSI